MKIIDIPDDVIKEYEEIGINKEALIASIKAILIITLSGDLELKFIKCFPETRAWIEKEMTTILRTKESIINSIDIEKLKKSLK